MAIEKAIHFFEEQKAVLEKHLKNGGEFAKEALEATNTALIALRKQVPRTLVDYVPEWQEGECPMCGYGYDGGSYCWYCGQRICLQLSECISRECVDCPQHDYNDRVCENYADKVDEIIRIHNEGVTK